MIATGLMAPLVSEALAVLRGAPSSDASLRERVENQAARFDEAYFRLEESGDQAQEALLAFSKARAMCALAFALAADDAQLHEAIYESLSALEEPGELLRLLEQTLG